MIALVAVAVLTFFFGNVIESQWLYSISIAGITALFVYGFLTAYSPWLVALAVFFYVGLALTELTSH